MKISLTHIEPLASSFFDASYNFSNLPEQFIPFGVEPQEVGDFFCAESKMAFLDGVKWMNEMNGSGMSPEALAFETDVKMIELYAYVMSSDPTKPEFAAKYNQEYLLTLFSAYFIRGANWIETYRRSRAELN